MIIRKFYSQRFAGMKDIDVAFEPGLNVILGPNEAGKSTVVDGIYHTLFQRATINRRTTAGQEFMRDYAPYPNGDYFEGSLDLQLANENIHINKQWGANPHAKLVLEDGTLVTDENRVMEVVMEKLKIGTATVSHLVFARQKEIKRALEALRSTQATSALDVQLRRTVMDLGGMSVDKFQRQLQEEIEGLLSKWHLNLNAPQDYRGINNPWKQKVGTVCKTYYEKEELQRQIKAYEEVEGELQKLTAGIQLLSAKRESTDEEIRRLAILEDDLNERAAQEPLLQKLCMQEESLLHINKQWPLLQYQHRTAQEELQVLKQQLSHLQTKLGQAELAVQKRALQKRLGEVEALQLAIGENKQKQQATPCVSPEQLQQLENLLHQQLRSQAGIEAGEMLGELEVLVSAPAYLSQGFKGRKQIAPGQTFTAEGYFKLEIDKVLSLEVRSANIDFDSLKKSYQEVKEAHQELLKELGVKDIAEARQALDTYGQLNRENETYTEQIHTLLEGQCVTQLQHELAQVEGLDLGYDVDEIWENINHKEQQRVKIEVQIENMQEKMAVWEEAYGHSDTIIDALVSVRGELQKARTTLSQKAPLPTEFDSIAEFKHHLRRLRQQKDDVIKEYDTLRDTYFNTLSQLPDTSYEELCLSFQDAKRKHANSHHRAKVLLRIQQATEDELKHVADDPYEPLVRAFRCYLSAFTGHKYHVGQLDVDRDLEVSIGETGKPVHLLSTGTYDGVALALRLAMIDVLFTANPGLVVLDDCLTDLDPKRKQQAATAIREFATKHQVIFTTCDPQTATLLAGSVINLPA